MPLSNEELGEHIASLERLLQGNPAGQTAALTGYVHKLDALTRSGDHEPAEKTLQLLGTAVGGRSRFNALAELTLLTADRTMADTIQRQWHLSIHSSRLVYCSP